MVTICMGGFFSVSVNVVSVHVDEWICCVIVWVGSISTLLDLMPTGFRTDYTYRCDIVGTPNILCCRYTTIVVRLVVVDVQCPNKFLAPYQHRQTNNPCNGRFFVLFVLDSNQIFFAELSSAINTINRSQTASFESY